MGLIVKEHSYTEFHKDIKFGRFGEKIFKEDFLEFLKINYVDVTGKQAFQIIDNDFLSSIGTYEIKLNYRDNKEIIIEEYTNVEEKYGPKSKGWFYKSKADMLVFISKNTRAMILIPFTIQFKNHYEEIKKVNDFKLHKNKISFDKTSGSKWQSAFRKIPLSSLNGFFSYYKRVTE
jgi:hypothetical protein